MKPVPSYGNDEDDQALLAAILADRCPSKAALSQRLDRLERTEVEVLYKVVGVELIEYGIDSHDELTLYGRIVERVLDGIQYLAS